MKELLAILNNLHPDVDFEKEEALVSGGILDSFDIVSLVTELNSVFDIEITASDLVLENFDSISAMYALMERLLEE